MKLPEMKPDPRRLGLGAMQKLARLHGGACVSKEYLNAHQKLDWRCKKNHVWQSTPSNVQRGHWCPTCRQLKQENERLDKARAAAQARGGKCLSKTVPAMIPQSNDVAPTVMCGNLIGQALSRRVTGAPGVPMIIIVWV
ncbi:hypothetical protein AGMMS50256_21770 [Betaproteobacteria bacterium]|nr:hypothetical protein AGMMS50256_21770 [Betaproteobacteria bacterium]